MERKGFTCDGLKIDQFSNGASIKKGMISGVALCSRACTDNEEDCQAFAFDPLTNNCQFYGYSGINMPLVESENEVCFEVVPMEDCTILPTANNFR